MANLSGDTVFDILNHYLRQHVPPAIFPIITIIADDSYKTVPSIWLRDTILHDPILSPSRYRKDIFDCDDYVMYLKSRVSLYAANKRSFDRPIAAGFLLTQLHAFNFGISDDNQFFLINTQSNKVDMIVNPSPQECEDFLAIAQNNPVKLIYI